MDVFNKYLIILVTYNFYDNIGTMYAYQMIRMELKDS